MNETLKTCIISLHFKMFFICIDTIAPMVFRSYSGFG